MVDIASITQAAQATQVAQAVQSAPAPKEVKKAAPAPAAPRIEQVPINYETSTEGSAIVAPPVESAADPLNTPINDISAIVGEVNSNLQIINADLAIEVDRELKQVIFKVVDMETGETIKQIPSKELIEIAKRLKHMIENYSNRGSSGQQLLMDADSFI